MQVKERNTGQVRYFPPQIHPVATSMVAITNNVGVEEIGLGTAPKCDIEGGLPPCEKIQRLKCEIKCESKLR